MATIAFPETEVAGKQEIHHQVHLLFRRRQPDDNGKMKHVLGGKGAGLAEMTNARLPVPPGFTIQT